MSRTAKGRRSEDPLLSAERRRVELGALSSRSTPGLLPEARKSARCVTPATARFGSWIRMAIHNAWAATGPEPVYLLPGGVTDVPRADIEIDVDMESTNDGVYMWGASLTDRANTAITPGGYRAFVRWEPPHPGDRDGGVPGVLGLAY